MKRSELKKVIAEYQEINEQINQLEKRKAHLAERVKRHMGDRQEERLDDFIIRFQAVESNRFDLSSFKEQHGDLYKAFTRHPITRRFSIVCARKQIKSMKRAADIIPWTVTSNQRRGLWFPWLVSRK